MGIENVGLTSSEIAAIWTSYMNNSMSGCILSYMAKHVEDKEIYPFIEKALTISREKVKELAKIFSKEGFAMPQGFTKADVNLNAPKLYTDSFCLTYINHMAKAGLLGYSGFLSMSTREDLLQFFSKALSDTNQLYNETIGLALRKGTIVKAPYIPDPIKQDFIDSKSYLSGFHLFNKQRPLNTIEMSHLFMNIQTNVMGSRLSMSFAQVSSLKEIQEFMLRGVEISQKHIKIFSSLLLEENVQPPMSPDIAITDSTSAPYSDKLMMFHMALLNATGTGNYAAAAAASQRSDLALNYERLSLEVAQYAKSAADIMIKHHWLEQPPGLTDKEKLAREKQT